MEKILMEIQYRFFCLKDGQQFNREELAEAAELYAIQASMWEW